MNWALSLFRCKGRRTFECFSNGKVLYFPYESSQNSSSFYATWSIMSFRCTFHYLAVYFLLYQKCLQLFSCYLFKKLAANGQASQGKREKSKPKVLPLHYYPAIAYYIDIKLALNFFRLKKDYPIHLL